MTRRTKTRNEKALTLARSTATRLASALETYQSEFPDKCSGSDFPKVCKKMLRSDNAPTQSLVDICQLHYDGNGPAQKLSAQAIVTRLLQFHDVAGTVQSNSDAADRKLPFKSWIKLGDLAMSLCDGRIHSWSGFQYLVQPMLMAEAMDEDTIYNKTIYQLYMSNATLVDDYIAQNVTTDQTVTIGQKENKRTLPVAQALRETMRQTGVAPSTATTQRSTSMHLLHWFEFGVNNGNEKIVTFDRNHSMFRAILALLGDTPVAFD